MKILFIGGTGVISSSCSQLCLEKGYDFFLLNRGKSIRTAPEGAKIILGDINDVASIKKLMENEKFDSVVDWIAFTENNVKRDFELFRDKTEQYIFISSASAYSPKRVLPITEKTPLENPYWAYSRAKIECENYLMKKYREEKFPVTIVRPSHTYDKTKNLLRADYLPFYRMKNGKPVIIHDEGKSLWTLTHTKDFAKGFVGLLGNKKAIGEAYHITSDEVLTWNQIAETLAEKAGYEIKISHVPSKFIEKYDEEWGAGLFGDKANDAVFDNSKIRTIVPDFKATIPFSQGAEEIVEWYSNPQNQIVDEKLDELMDKIISDYSGK
jgi:nucleoside-diphosphate-sugar epimerase